MILQPYLTDLQFNLAFSTCYFENDNWKFYLRRSVWPEKLFAELRKNTKEKEHPTKDEMKYDGLIKYMLTDDNKFEVLIQYEDHMNFDDVIANDWEVWQYKY